jgi:hypothetical protein
METLLGVKHLMRNGDFMFSFDLQDGFNALGINQAYRDDFTVNVRSQHYNVRQTRTFLFTSQSLRKGAATSA